jgi:hypothetical protein
MYNRYGQLIKFGTVSSPHLFSGSCTQWSYNPARTEMIETGEGGDNEALILHSLKADFSFEAKIRAASTDFLDLSENNAAVVIDGISGGTCLVRRAVESYKLMRSKTAAVNGTHYPNVTQASPATAGATIDAFGSAQSLAIVTPSDVIQFSTVGLGHASGVVHGLDLIQELSITEDESSPAGEIVGVVTHGYLRRIELDLLASSTGSAPAPNTTLALTGAPERAGGYKIVSAPQTFTELKGAMYRITAVWIPPFAES